MRDAGAEARELLNRPFDREAHRAHGLVGRPDGVDGALRRRVQLVELCIHPVHRSPDLFDHWQNRTFRSPDQRRKSVESYGEPEKRPADTETDGDQEHGKREIGEISEREGDHQQQA